MEKLLNPYDREYMKMAMLKHEETFKEQVCELHRLYHIQKMLMKNIEVSGSSTGQSQERRSMNHHHHHHHHHHHQGINHQQEKQKMKQLDLERPAEEYNAGEESEDDDNGVLEIVDESKLELTLGPAVLSHSRRRKKAESTPLTSDSGPSFSSSSTGSSHMKRTNESRTTTTTRDRIHQSTTPHDWGFQTGTKKGFHHLGEQQLRQERLDHHRHQPPWIFQVLSLNMT